MALADPDDPPGRARTPRPTRPIPRRRAYQPIFYRLRRLRLAACLERVRWVPGQEHSCLPTARS